MKSTTTIFTPWVAWFGDQAAPELPWDQHAPLDAVTRARVQGPLRLFQRGESSDARHLLGKAERFAYRTGQVDYYRALQALVAEEHRHAAWLGTFMELEGIAPARTSALDLVFRRLRHALPLPGAVALLMVAETIAEPFYRALHDATPSAVLKAICKQILADEALHLRFQAHSLRQLRTGLSAPARRALDLGARAALTSALHALWPVTKDLFLSVDMDFPQLVRASRAQFRQLWAVVDQRAPLTAPLEREYDLRRHHFQLQPCL